MVDTNLGSITDKSTPAKGGLVEKIQTWAKTHLNFIFRLLREVKPILILKEYYNPARISTSINWVLHSFIKSTSRSKKEMLCQTSGSLILQILSLVYPFSSQLPTPYSRRKMEYGGSRQFKT